MNNGFKVKKGLSVIGSGSIIVDVQGSQGQLFSVTDSLSGSLFAVSDISGIPIVEVFSNEVVKMGTYGTEALTISGSQVFLPNYISGSSSTELLVVNTTTKRIETKTEAAPSDIRLKDNVVKIESSLEKVEKIGGYTFEWNQNQNTHNGTDYGVIAQEIEQIMPEIVITTNNGYKAVKYEKIIPLLIESIKELKKELDILKNQI